MFMPLLVALLLPAAEPNEAEKLFRDMEKKITSAKTLECDFETTMEGGPGFKLGGKGSLTLAEGNKCHIEGSIDENGKVIKGMFTSDGKSMQGVQDGKVQPKMDTPKEFEAAIRAAISRTGVFVLGFQPLDLGEKEFKIDEAFKVSDFKLGKKEKIGEREAQEIQYALNVKGPKEPLAVSVWLDTKTNLPLKRVMTATMGTEKFTFTETCPKLILDPKIDAKKFELPKE